MFKKLTALAAAVIMLNACAAFGVKKDYESMAHGRETPRFFAHGESAAAFKIEAVIRDVNLEGVTIIKDTGQNTYSIKIMGPLGTKIVDAVFDGAKMRYDYILPDINTGLIKNRFEKFIFTLLKEPGKIQKVSPKKDGALEVKRAGFDGGSIFYVYETGLIYPFKMTSGSVQMLYSEYTEYEDGQLPGVMRYSDAFAEAYLTLTLISVR